jgi:hypothetical protein
VVVPLRRSVEGSVHQFSTRTNKGSTTGTHHLPTDIATDISLHISGGSYISAEIF